MFRKISQTSEENIFIRVAICQDAGLELATLSGKRIQHRCFAMKFVKFFSKQFHAEQLRTTVFGSSEAFWEINILEIENSVQKLQQWR